MSFTIAANHLATAVSELPDYVQHNRKVAVVGNPKTASIYGSDGKIKTGDIDGWKDLPYADKRKVWAERRRLGIRFKPRKGKNDSNTNNTIKQLKDVNQEYKRKIKALSKVTDDEDSSGGDGSKPKHDAGDQFGGKRVKMGKRD